LCEPDFFSSRHKVYGLGAGGFQSAFIGHIVEGHFNGTPLVGLNWAALYKWPGEIKDGNGKRQIVIDERADKAQRIALEAIILGEAGRPLSNLFSVFASTCSEFCETLFLTMCSDVRHWWKLLD
jgi:hypothetical protein